MVTNLKNEKKREEMKIVRGYREKEEREKERGKRERKRKERVSS